MTKSRKKFYAAFKAKIALARDLRTNIAVPVLSPEPSSSPGPGYAGARHDQ